MWETNNFVKKLLKSKWKILHISKIKEIYYDLIENPSDKKLYKQIYQLKNKWYMLSLKKDLFYIKKLDDDISIDEVIEKNYWKYLRSYLKEQFWTFYFIWWLKSLELWNNNFSIPDKITIVNPYKRSNEVLFKERNLFLVDYSIKWFDKEKSFKFFKKQTTKLYIEWKFFYVANYELALLESLYSMSFEEENYILELVKKNIRKNWKKINLDVFVYFLKYGKYWSSVKKIYELSLWIRPDFAEKIKDILKKWYWL